LALVIVDENEPIEKALRRFKRKVQREAIMKDYKKNSVYMTPGEKRRLKDQKARKRIRRRQHRNRNQGY
jgi:small subunit ribosomal protein S21